jgi:hypothetical protein
MPDTHAILTTDPLADDDDAALIANGYEPIPAIGKAPVVAGWQDGQITAERIGRQREAHPEATNTGLRTGRLVALDFDLPEHVVNGHLLPIIKECLGTVSPLRRVGKTGFLLLYRNTDTPLRKITIDAHSGAARIEILGAGQQFIAYGVHPDTGADYAWPTGAEPFLIPLADLPAATPEQVRTLARRLAEKLRTIGYPDTTISGDMGESAEATIPSPATGSPITAAMLRDMLGFIQPPEDRSAWLPVGLALQHGQIPLTEPLSEDEWHALQREWSCGDLWKARTGDAIVVHSYDPDGNDATLGDRARDKDTAGLGTVVRLAQAAGYRGPTFIPVPLAVQYAPEVATYAAPVESEAKGQDQPSRFVLRDWRARRDQQPITPLISGFLPDGGTALIYATRSSYKSFIATGLAFAVAADRPAFGKLKVHRSGPVIYFAGEGFRALETQRLAALCSTHGIPDDGRLPIYTVAGVPQPRHDDEAQACCAAIKATLGEQRPVVIIIDTLARALAGLNENDAGDASRFLELIETLSNAFQCLVVAIAHQGKDEGKGVRGSTNFEAGVDCLWHATADEATLTVELKSEKEKDGEAGAAIHLKGRAVVVAGTPRGSLVFECIDADEFRRARGKSAGITPGDVGRALQALKAVKGVSVTTRVLATEIADEGADDKTIAAASRGLQRGMTKRLGAYIAHFGDGHGDATLWTFPAVETEGQTDARD